MALTIKHINTDASFLITFEPVVRRPTPHGHQQPRPYRILLDPWITGPSKVIHSRFSISLQKQPACISSLAELPESDLVIISQVKSDHCNEATLRQIPPDAKTTILAEPAAARLIRSWKHFDRRKVRSLKHWGDTRAERDAVTRIPLPPIAPGGEPGEVTVAYIPQRRDLTGLHAAVAITFRPPRLPQNSIPGPSQQRHTVSQTSQSTDKLLSLPRAAQQSLNDLPEASMPCMNFSLPTIHAGHKSSFSYAPNHPTASPPISPVASLTRNLSTASTLLPSTSQRTLSLLFSPHGMVFPGVLASFASTHLVNEAALPLSALLHCFNNVSNPWWLGGNVLLGAPAGKDIAVNLGARCWVSCHDGEKEVRGLATEWVRMTRWERDMVESALVADGEGTGKRGSRVSGKDTQVLDLKSGEEVVVTADGVWNAESMDQVDESGKSYYHTEKNAKMRQGREKGSLNDKLSDASMAVFI